MDVLGKWKLTASQVQRTRRSLAKRADTDPTLLYPERNISVPVDFFHNETRYEPHSNESFNLRYWFDDTYYKPGGPVFVLLGGETDGAGRLPYLQKGIVHQVIKATNGLGVILEHRYYGKSFPVPDLTTKNLRFLTTEQALAEIDYFAKNVKFEGIDADLTAPNTPWVRMPVAFHVNSSLTSSRLFTVDRTLERKLRSCELSTQKRSGEPSHHPVLLLPSTTTGSTSNPLVSTDPLTA